MRYTRTRHVTKNVQNFRKDSKLLQFSVCDLIALCMHSSLRFFFFSHFMYIFAQRVVFFSIDKRCNYKPTTVIYCTTFRLIIAQVCNIASQYKYADETQSMCTKQRMYDINIIMNKMNLCVHIVYFVERSHACCSGKIAKLEKMKSQAIMCILDTSNSNSSGQMSKNAINSIFHCKLLLAFLCIYLYIKCTFETCIAH